MTPFQVLCFLASKNGSFHSKDGKFTLQAGGLYSTFTVPNEEQQSGLSNERFVKLITEACESIKNGLEGVKPNGPESPNV